MPKCQSVRSRRRKLCVGDLDRQIQILSPEMVPPVFGSTNYGIKVDSDDAQFIWCSLTTKNGVTLFDGTGIERDLTHEFKLYFDETITSEKIVLFEGVLYEILKVEDLEERHEWLVLKCTERGTKDNKANFTS